MKKENIFFYLLLIVIGFILGKMVFIPGITMDLSINPLHLLSIITTIGVAVFIGIIYNKNASYEVKRKEHVQHLLDKSLSSIQSLKEIIDLNSSFTLTTAISYCKDIRRHINSSYDVLGVETIDERILDKSIKYINSVISDNKTIDLDGKKINKPIKIKDGNVAIPPELKIDILKQITKLDSEILHWKAKIWL